MNPKTRFHSRRIAFAIVCMALGVALAPFTSIPIGIAKINPTQHFLNVMVAVVLGPLWSTSVAGGIGLIRLAMGTGTVLAFPGGMIGALLAGIAARIFKKPIAAAIGEVVGTGLVAPVVSAALVAPMVMGRSMDMTALMIAFSLSSLAGATLGVLALISLKKANVLPVLTESPADAEN